jgi:hypothetical protein
VVDGPGAFFPAISCINFFSDTAIFFPALTKRWLGFYNLSKRIDAG